MIPLSKQIEMAHMKLNSSHAREKVATKVSSDLPVARISGHGRAAIEVSAPQRGIRSRELLDAVLELVKIRITFFVGMSALFGYVMAGGGISAKMMLSSFGILLVACGSAVLNHYQERSTDALMHRTRNRPLPSGTIAPAASLALLVSLVIAGSALTYVWGNAAAVIVSLLALVWYNAIYTPLKKVTAYAVIPGSFVGSLPVMAGWAAAGGYLLDPRLIVLFAYFFVWQIPHFWLLMDIYSVDYERANFPTLRNHLSGKKFSLFTYAWIILLVMTSALFMTTGIVRDPVAGGILIALGAWLVIGTFSIVKRQGDKLAYKSAFMKINIYVLAVTVVVLVDALFKMILPWRL